MYAVIETGGKQYRVQPGDIVTVEKLEGDVGAAVKFDQVLLVSKEAGEKAQIWLGKPTLNGAAVDAEIVGQGRGEKVLIIKMKRRKGYRKTQGHRQSLTQVLVTGLSNGAGETATLSADQKKTTLSKFHTPLKAKGLAMTPKTLGSRKRLAQARAAGQSAAPAEAATAPKTKKTAAKAAGAAASKKAPAKKKAE
jgi:large subunit ribosomal protein L21